MSIRPTVGCDPGKTGGLALLEDEALVDLILMPSYEGPSRGFKLAFRKDGTPYQRAVKGKQFVDFVKVRDILQEWRWRYLEPPDIVIEDVHAMPEQGVTGAFSFGFDTGHVHGIALGLGYAPRKVHGATWKAESGVSALKETSIAKAKGIWTHALLDKDGCAEAALIARWGFRHRAP